MKLHLHANTEQQMLKINSVIKLEHFVMDFFFCLSGKHKFGKSIL